jgi:hypothetical protein
MWRPLNAADEQDRRTLDWKRLRPWRDVPSRATRAGSLTRLSRVLQGKRPVTDVKNHLFFARYIQSEERLKYLVELETTLP